MTMTDLMVKKKHLRISRFWKKELSCAFDATYIYNQLFLTTIVRVTISSATLLESSALEQVLKLV